MGLLFTNVTVDQSPNYPQKVNHHYETPPEVIKKMDDWRRELVGSWIEQQLTNNYIETKCWTHYVPISDKYIIVVAAKINGETHKFEYEIRRYEAETKLSEKTVEKIREGVAELVLKPMIGEILSKMQIDGVFGK